MILPAVAVNVPSVKLPPCTAPLNVAATPEVILPELILNVPSVTVPPSKLPVAVTDVTETSLSRLTVNVCPDPAVLMLVPPLTVNV